MIRTVIAIDIANKAFSCIGLNPTPESLNDCSSSAHRCSSGSANGRLRWLPWKPVVVPTNGEGSWSNLAMPPKAVRPFVQRNKTDAADAQAIWTACQQPGMRFVPVKTEDQQAVLAMHRVRSQLMKMRIMQTNELRGLLYEFGIVLPEGHAALLKAWPNALVEAQQRLPGVMIDSLVDQRKRIDALQADLTAVEKRLARQLRANQACQAIAAVPGVGVLTATAVVATMGSPAAFDNARQFAAWLGLVPRQRGTGGRIRQLGISKRGDVYVRTLLMHGARAAILKARATHSWPWLQAMIQRRPYNVVVAAVANKMARTMWAILARGQQWRPGTWMQIQPA